LKHTSIVSIPTIPCTSPRISGKFKYFGGLGEEKVEDFLGKNFGLFVVMLKAGTKKSAPPVLSNILNF